MSRTIKILLYTVLAIAFVSNYVSTNATLDSLDTSQYIVYINEFPLYITEELFNMSVAFASILNYAALMVIINVINVTNKNTEVTQGTLDNKQNVTLTNQAVIMETQKVILGGLFVLDEEVTGEKVAELNQRIPLTTKLANTHIDFKSVDIQNKIQYQESIIEQLKVAIDSTFKAGDLKQQKVLENSLAIAQKTLSTLTKDKTKV